jgi:hypothetical protein
VKRRWREVDHLEADERIRPFRASDILGALILCPHCQQRLRVIDVDGPYLGYNPELRALDRFFIVTFTDGASSRFWTDHKGFVEKIVNTEATA